MKAFLGSLSVRNQTLNPQPPVPPPSPSWRFAVSHTKLQMSPWVELMRRTIGGKPVIWLPRASAVRSGGGAVMCRRSLSSSSSLRRDDGSVLNSRVVARCSLQLVEFSLFCLLAGRPDAKEGALQEWWCAFDAHGGSHYGINTRRASGVWTGASAHGSWLMVIYALKCSLISEPPLFVCVLACVCVWRRSSSREER